MGETNTFVFLVDQLGPDGQKLLGYVQQHPVECGVISCLIVAGVATIVVPIALGFGGSGVGAGTLAAAWHSSIGNVTAGSLFATLQSMSANGTLVSVGGMLIGSGVGAGALAAANDWAKGVDWAKSVDWAQGANWNGWAQAAGLAGSEAWRNSEDLARCVGRETERAANDAAKGTVWAANEAAKGAGWAANETVKGAGWAANETAKGAGWAANEAAKGFGRMFGGW